MLLEQKKAEARAETRAKVRAKAKARARARAQARAKAKAIKMRLMARAKTTTTAETRAQTITEVSAEATAKIVLGLATYGILSKWVFPGFEPLTGYVPGHTVHPETAHDAAWAYEDPGAMMEVTVLRVSCDSAGSNSLVRSVIRECDLAEGVFRRAVMVKDGDGFFSHIEPVGRMYGRKFVEVFDETGASMGEYAMYYKHALA